MSVNYAATRFPGPVNAVSLAADARHFQIATLAGLLVLHVSWFDLGAHSAPGRCHERGGARGAICLTANSRASATLCAPPVTIATLSFRRMADSREL